MAAVVVIAGVGFGMAWNAGNGAKPIASNQQAAQGNSGGSGNGSAAAGQQAQQASQQARQTQPADEKAAEEARQRAEEEQARQQADQLRQEAFGSFPHDFAFASGAGGWSTDMTIQPDGTFAGQWHDSNMGESGPGYQASLYVCGFEGKFTVLEKVSDTEFLLQLDYLRPTNGSSEEIDSSGLRTVYTDDEPYGLGDMTETPVRGWHLYLPGQSTAGFSDDVKMWIFRTSSSYTDVLNMYALADDATGNGWSG